VTFNSAVADEALSQRISGGHSDNRSSISSCCWIYQFEYLEFISVQVLLILQSWCIIF